MSAFEYRAADIADLEPTVELMALGFPAATKFSPNFLRWQYYDNPVGSPLGCNAFDGTRQVGHLMGIPLEVRLHGQACLVTLIMNVAVHPTHRGRGVILALVREVIAMSAARGHRAVLGVANQNSVGAFEHKLGFQNVAGLSAHLEWLPHRIAIDRALHDAEFARRWNDATLTWRMANPGNRLHIASMTADSLVIEGACGLPLMQARAVIPRAGLSLTGSTTFAPRPAVVIGLVPGGTLHRRLAVTIPERLRPSPLRLIYLDHQDAHARLDATRILLSYLDFDAF